MEVQGKVKMVGETQTFGTNGFRKREVVVTTEEQYPQHIMVEFVQDKCDLLNNVSVGQPVKIGINLRGREWVNPQGEANTSAGIPPVPPMNAFEPADDLNEDDHDDLPF